MLIPVEGTGKNQLQPGVRGSATVLSHCSLLRNPRPKPAGVLEHCREREPNGWFSFRMRFLLTASQKRRMISMYSSLFGVAIPVN